MSFNKLFYEKVNWGEMLTAVPPYIADYLKAETEFFRKHFPKGAILDVGCGTGRTLFELKEAIEQGHGIDISLKSIQRCKRILPHYSFVVGSITHPPYPDSFFDAVIFSFNLLGNLNSEKVRAFEETRRILKPEGILLFSVYSEHAQQIQERFYRTVPLSKDVESGEGYTSMRTEYGPLRSERFTKKSLENLLGNELVLVENPFTYFGKVKVKK